MDNWQRELLAAQEEGVPETSHSIAWWQDLIKAIRGADWGYWFDAFGNANGGGIERSATHRVPVLASTGWEEAPSLHITACITTEVINEFCHRRLESRDNSRIGADA
ncbi:c9c6320d-fb20-4bfa-bdf2-0e2d0bd89c35 [Thermothielavioides terrestris]|uniref:C9c6320d-fb20-4bfa-bdf2-0e2d0bd89c35 n=1 Tax=Thermothielavioides terrestris TaxID=2587410 RepID=A0A446BLM1_9PEZI|nr:c9c6320d-fb20-4bfa-bdf2-0e2d0bd89c35 [Thermothielavioides terrestris]